MTLLRKFLIGIAGIVVSISSFAQATLDDNSITKTIQAQFASQANNIPNTVMVTTQNGVVHLSGKVDTTKQAVAAVQTAASVSGVKDVNIDNLNAPRQKAFNDEMANSIKSGFAKQAQKIKAGQPVLGDKAIEKNLTAIFARDYTGNVTVTSQDGHVSLSGDFGKDPGAMPENAVQEIASTPGVKSVDFAKLIAPRELDFDGDIMGAKAKGFILQSKLFANSKIPFDVYADFEDASVIYLDDSAMKTTLPQSERDKILTIVKNIPGVTDVSWGPGPTG